MAKAFKCDLTGKLIEGDGHLNVAVQIRPDFKLTVVPHVSTDKGKSYANGNLSDEAARKITEVLQKALNAELPK